MYTQIKNGFNIDGNVHIYYLEKVENIKRFSRLLTPLLRSTRTDLYLVLIQFSNRRTCLIFPSPFAKVEKSVSSNF